jgi:hypothetical protein
MPNIYGHDIAQAAFYYKCHGELEGDVIPSSPEQAALYLAIADYLDAVLSRPKVNDMVECDAFTTMLVDHAVVPHGYQPFDDNARGGMIPSDLFADEMRRIRSSIK